MSPAANSIFFTLLVCLMISSTAPAALAQSGTGQPGAVVRSAEEASTIVYGPEFFARYNVITATDMIRRIPGTAAILDSQREGVRGFGSGGDQILINGERIAGKANEITSALERIQASQVIRIELIRGTSGQFDVRSEGLIINIVLSGEAGKAAGSWSLEGEYMAGGLFRPAAALSYGGDWRRLNYFVGLKIGNGFRRELVDDRFFSPDDGLLFERRDEEQIFRFRPYTLTTNLIYRFERGDQLRVNGLVEFRRFTETESSDQFAVDAAGVETFLQSEPRLFLREGFEWELGADYERPMGSTGRWKVVFVHTDDDLDDREDQRRILAGVDRLVFVEATDSVARETILRTSYKWDVGKRQNLEIGIEGALNTLDTALEVFEDVDGTLTGIDIFNPDSSVKETRVEGFSTHVWKPASRLTVESSFNAEYSRLEQSGSDIDVTRTFFFLKPRADIRFDITPSKQIRFEVERTVSQLNFEDFVSTFDEEDDLPDSGNPDLVPEKAWEFELTYEQRLANDGGVLKARLFYNDISDKIDVVIGNIGGDRSATGNVGDATFFGGEVNASIRLSKLGVPDAVVTGSYTRQRSQLTDFFTGERHGFFRTPKTIWKFGYRHDTRTRYSLSYGLDMTRRGKNPTDDIDEHRIFHARPEFSAFVEARLFGRFTVRIEAERLLRDLAHRERTRFVGNKVRGEILQTEILRRARVRSVTMSVRGNF